MMKFKERPNFEANISSILTELAECKGCSFAQLKKAWDKTQNNNQCPASHGECPLRNNEPCCAGVKLTEKDLEAINELLRLYFDED